MNKKLRRILVIILLLISLGLLIWGFYPFDQVTQSVPLPPGELELPTPSGFLLEIWVS
jgi:hypothetical protein